MRHEEITGKKLGDVLAQAMRRGFDQFPYKSSREGGLWVLKYEVRHANR